MQVQDAVDVFFGEFSHVLLPHPYGVLFCFVQKRVMDSVRG